jgi:peptidoglycan/xylan/chitin deacetylase (PgdA/CDA1 family)
MTPAEVSDLVERTRSAMEAVTSGDGKRPWAYRTPPGLQAARYALEYGLTAGESALRSGVTAQTVQRHMRRLRRAA